MIWPSPLEFAIRVLRSDVYGMSYLQTKKGIGHELGNGFIVSSDEVGKISGGARFGIVNIKESLKRKIREYDSLVKQLSLLQERQHIDNNLILELTKQSQFLEEELNSFDIPLDKTLRRNKMQNLFDRWETQIEKTSNNTGMPLIASVSGSTSRVLISLLDLQGFISKGVVDIENIQLASNCIMAFFIQAGHHSFLEVAEVYN